MQRLLVAERGVEAQPGARQPSPELEVEDARKQGVAVVLDVEAAPDVDPRRSVIGQASTVTPRSIPSALGSPPRSVLAAPPERFVPEELGGTLLAAEHLARYWWASGAAAGADVLDAGCGVGFGTKLLVEAGARSATGVDIAEEAVAGARERCGEGATFHVATWRRCRWPTTPWTSRCASRHSSTSSGRERVIAELRRVLRGSGTLAISSPNRLVSAGENPHHEREFSPGELRSALGESFDTVTLLSQQSWLASVLTGPEGRGGDPAREVDLAVRTETAPVPDEETYLVAVAGAGPPPAELARGVAFLADPRGPEKLDAAIRWNERQVYVESARAARAEAEAEALRRDLEIARAALESIQSSPSWRLTEPMRRAKSSLLRRR